MRSFITETNKKNLLKRTDYILSRQYGVLARTTYIDTSSTDSTQAQVDAESKYDNIRDKHNIVGAMIYDEHYQLDFPCYESCLLFKVTFQVMAPFDQGTKIGIFNDKAPVVIIDMHNPETAGEEHDYYEEINDIVIGNHAYVETPYDNYVVLSQFNDNMDSIIIPSIYGAKNTNYPNGNPDIYGRDSNVMPEINDPESPSTSRINDYDVFKFTGDDYSVKPDFFDITWYFNHNQYYQVSPPGTLPGTRWWRPVYLDDRIGYEYYYIYDSNERLIPRIINVDPYETEDGEMIPVQLHARVIGNESKSAFGYLTVETYPVIRQ